MKCQHCNHKLTPGAAFCGNCGTPVPGSTATTVPSPPGAPSQSDTKLSASGTAQTATAPLPQMPGPANPFAGQVSDKSYITTFLFAFFLGFFGVDRFYTGQIGLGIFKLLFSWLTFGIWPLIDIILILAGSRKDKYGRELYGRDKDFKASLLIFIVLGSLVILGNIVFGIIAVINDGSMSGTSSSQTSNDPAAKKELTKPFGATITLSDSDNNNFSMTATKLIANAQPIDPASDAAATGKQLVAVELTAKAGDDGPISEDVVSAARLIDNQGYSYAPDATEITGCPSFPNGYIELNSGDMLKGCISFRVPTNSDISRFRFLPYSESVDQAATWEVKQ